MLFIHLFLLFYLTWLISCLLLYFIHVNWVVTYLFFFWKLIYFFHYDSYIEFCSLRKIKLFLPLIVMQLTVTHFQIFVSMLLILDARLCTWNIFSWSLISIMKLEYHRKNSGIAIELVSFSLRWKLPSPIFCQILNLCEQQTINFLVLKLSWILKKNEFYI